MELLRQCVCGSLGIRDVRSSWQLEMRKMMKDVTLGALHPLAIPSLAAANCTAVPMPGGQKMSPRDSQFGVRVARLQQASANSLNHLEKSKCCTTYHAILRSSRWCHFSRLSLKIEQLQDGGWDGFETGHCPCLRAASARISPALLLGTKGPQWTLTNWEKARSLEKCCL